MLYVFRARNFGAFRDLVELDLRHTARAPRPSSTTWNPAISSVAAVFGPNASGKSTLVAAIEFAHRAVADSFTRWQPDGAVPRRPFLLDENSTDVPTEIELEFSTQEGDEYRYGFRAGDHAIRDEWLYQYGKGIRHTQRKILEREADGAGISFGASFRGERRAIIEAVKSRPNALLLSTGAQFGASTLLEPFRWITRFLRFYAASSFEAGVDAARDVIDRNPAIAQPISSVLSSADLGVCGIQTKELPMPETSASRLRTLLKALHPEASEEQIAQDVEDAKRSIVLSHRGPGGVPVPFPPGQESEGTRALLAFTPVLIQALRDGATVVFDEIDTSLHPLIVRSLVDVFTDPQTNPRQAQLVFTTHDVSLLGAPNADDTPLQRDQIWITEKQSDGTAQLLGIADYRSTPRRGESLLRGYLTGRYGGIPLTDIHDAFATAVNGISK